MKKRILEISILLSVMSITLTVLINFRIAATYISADGKTKALFGIIELTRFYYQYVVTGLGILAAFLVFSGDEAGSWKKYMAAGLSLVAILIVFLRIWRLFV